MLKHQSNAARKLDKFYDGWRKMPITDLDVLNHLVVTRLLDFYRTPCHIIKISSELAVLNKMKEQL